MEDETAYRALQTLQKECEESDKGAYADCIQRQI